MNLGNFFFELGVKHRQERMVQHLQNPDNHHLTIKTHRPSLSLTPLFAEPTSRSVTSGCSATLVMEISAPCTSARSETVQNMRMRRSKSATTRWRWWTRRPWRRRRSCIEWRWRGRLWRCWTILSCLRLDSEYVTLIHCNFAKLGLMVLKGEGVFHCCRKGFFFFLLRNNE